MGEVFAGRYELVDPLASGGAGVIWRVWDQREEEFRAGKVLKQSDSASLLRFMRETSWRIEHPHVITPLGWVGEDDRVMFTMPLVRGGSLSALLKQHGPLPPRWAVRATDQVLDALTAVHATGLVHRDIKPANLMLRPALTGAEPFVMLTDFGIAAPVGDPRLTRVTEVIGTPGYMSPEALRGLDPDPKQDLYAVGVVLLEMLTGQRPPTDGRPEIPAAAAGLPLGLLIAKLLADEGERYTSAEAVRADLKGIDLPTSRVKPVAVPDIIPTLPAGWGGRPQVAAQTTKLVDRGAAGRPSPAVNTPRPFVPPARPTGPSAPSAATPPPSQAHHRPPMSARPINYPPPQGRPVVSPAPVQVTRSMSGMAGEISPWAWAGLVLLACVFVAVLLWAIFG